LPRSGPDENQHLLLRRIGPKPDALPGVATVNHADDVRQAGRAAFELQQPVRRLAKPIVVDAVTGGSYILICTVLVLGKASWHNPQ